MFKVVEILVTVGGAFKILFSVFQYARKHLKRYRGNVKKYERRLNERLEKLEAVSGAKTTRTDVGFYLLNELNGARSRIVMSGVFALFFCAILIAGTIYFANVESTWMSIAWTTIGFLIIAPACGFFLYVFNTMMIHETIVEDKFNQIMNKSIARHEKRNNSAINSDEATAEHI